MASFLALVQFCWIAIISFTCSGSSRSVCRFASLLSLEPRLIIVDSLYPCFCIHHRNSSILPKVVRLAIGDSPATVLVSVVVVKFFASSRSAHI